MAVTVSRERLLHALESVQPGLSPRETVQQATCYIFDRGHVLAYNDEALCRAPSGLGKEVRGAVGSKKLADVLSRLQEDEISFEVEGGEVLLKTYTSKGRSKGRVWLSLEGEVRSKYADVPSPDEWKKLPPDFCDAISMAKECAKTKGDFLVCAIHISPKFVEACDGFQLCRWNLKTGFKKDTLVRKEFAQHVASLGMTEFGETDHWVHFRRTDDKGRPEVELAVRRYDDNYRDYGEYLGAEGSEVMLPKGFASEAEIGKIFSSEVKGNDRVLVEISPGSARLLSRGVTGRYEGPPRKLEGYSGEPFAFMIAPGMLSSLVERYSECILSRNTLSVQHKSEGKTVWTYVAWLFAPPEANGKAHSERGPAPEENEESPEEAGESDEGGYGEGGGE